METIKNTDPDAVICVGSYAACAAFLRDAVDAGLRVPIANLSFVGSENLLKLIAKERDNVEKYTNLLVHSQVVPSYEDESIPAVREYRTLVQRYDPQPPSHLDTEGYAPFPYSFASLEGFLNAKLMVDILCRLGPSPSREKLEQTVFSMQNFDIGIGERVSFSPDRRQGVVARCTTRLLKTGARFVPLVDWSARLGMA